MNKAFIPGNSMELISKLVEHGYEKLYDCLEAGSRTVLMSSRFGDFTHIAALRLLEADPMLDEAAIASIHRDEEGKLEELLKTIIASKRFPSWLEERMEHIYNTALIDGRLYQCRDWF